MGMGKKRLQTTLSRENVGWLDEMVKRGVFASKSHGIERAVAALRELHNPDRREEVLYCPKHGEIQLGRGKYCPKCGARLRKMPVGVTCPKCGRYYRFKQAYCVDCGAKLPQPEYRWARPIPSDVFSML